MVLFFAPTDYTIRVELERVDPLVWRRLRISSDLSLPLFARVLEAAMGWQSYHLHQFVSGNLTFGDADDEMGYTIDETNVVIKQILPEIGHEVRFDYDFGDDVIAVRDENEPNHALRRWSKKIAAWSSLRNSAYASGNAAPAQPTISPTVPVARVARAHSWRCSEVRSTALSST